MSGTYKDTVTNMSGCDSVITLDLTVDTTTGAQFTELSCDSIYLWIGDTLRTGGTYVDTIANMAGCDSIVTLNLTFGAPTSSIDTVTACDSYLWLGNSYDSSGVYLDTLVNASGCDSLKTLVLTVNRTSMRMDTVVNCEKFAWSRGGKVDTLRITGVYVDTLVNAAGCDSTMTLDLTINPISRSTVRDTACDSYVWSLNGKSYTSTGSYEYRIADTNSFGCDSVITLELIIKNSELSSGSITRCISYTWPQTGVTYTKSGTYNDVYTNSEGCDSIIQIRLNIKEVNVNMIKRQSDITVNQVGGEYQWIDCDADTVLTGETKQTFRAFKNGNYKVAVTFNGCTDTSLCIPVTAVGLGEQDLPSAAFMVMPNPTQGFLTVGLDGVQPDGDRVMVYDMTGNIVFEEILLNSGQQLDLTGLSDGLYMIRYKNILKKVVVSK